MYDKQEIFDALNALSAAWKELFDNPPRTPMLWSEPDEDGMAFLDELEVCPVAMVDECDLYYDAEDLWIGQVDGEVVHIKVDWRDVGEPQFYLVEG